MQRTIYRVLLSLLFTVSLISCDQGASLQSYFVNNQETPNFISVDIPTSFVNIDKTTLSEEQIEAYESVNKLNMLGYNLTENNIAEYEAELSKVKSILRADKYEELMTGGNASLGHFTIKYIGSDTSIDELIIFGSSKENGFAIVRVLGDDMEPAKLMTLGSALENVTSEENSVADFMKFFN
jgi:hypothetical protein